MLMRKTITIKFIHIMNIKQRVYIKGDRDRGDEIIKFLEDLGGSNDFSFTGKNEDSIYFINPNGIIVNNYYIGSEAFSYVKEFYKEIELPRWKPKHGDYYYFINYKGMAMRNTWFNSVNECAMYEFGNCFKTENEAIEARDKIKEILNNR